MRLILTTETRTRSIRVTVSGDVDFGQAAYLIDTVADLLSAHPDVQELHLDFTKLTFLDSTGLSALLQIHRQTTELGARMHLDNRPAHLDRILEITGLLDYLTANRSEETEVR
ncbi:STAS domain-containing protein [Mycolicibacterium elephantis]|uniref:STAS domain-containing protein n=1 Tax=Mycolicibacterium elephantis TaxID=81858 RepID=UPI0007E9EE8A|nr:STAS domain-containing protein [Mycolicibacterium elephantis]OBA77873.1 anti-anti-sigma factor [Mycolicibacterium elephantis]